MEKFDNYIPIRLITLRGSSPTTFSLYVKIDGKYIRYSHPGSSLEDLRIKRLKQKNKQEIFVAAGEFNAYQEYLKNNQEVAYNLAEKLPEDARNEIIHGHQQSMSEDLMENPHLPEYYDAARNCAQKYYGYIKNESKSLANLLKIPNTERTITHHCTNVAALSVAMAEQLMMDDDKNLEVLVLGSLIHDYEHYHTTANFYRDGDLIKEEDLKEYFLHPIVAYKKLKIYNYFDQQVLDIVLQHEETIDGKGFPQRLKESQINPLALIVAVANHFDRMIHIQKMDWKKALQQILIDKMGTYPLNYLKALQGALKKSGAI